MAIKKREDGTWIVSYSKRHPKTRVPVSARRYCNDKGEPIRSQAEAQRIFNGLVGQVQDTLRRAICPPWKNVCEEMIGYKLSSTEWSPKTAENYRIHLEAYTYPTWGERLIDSFNAQEIRDLVMIQMAERSDIHKKNVLKFLRSVFSFAVDRGYIKGNPVPTLKFKPRSKLTTVLTGPQMETLLTKAKVLEHPWYPVWAFACYLGMRSGELYALQWDQVDLDRMQIKVSRAWNSKDGFKTTKSGHDRWVKIPAGLAPMIAELKLKAGNDPFVLPRFTEWEKGEQARVLRAFLRGIGLPRVRFHDLRASWATLLLGQGVEPAKVMKLAGWADMKTMERYIRLSAIDLQGVMDDLVLHDADQGVGEILTLEDRRKKQ